MCRLHIALQELEAVGLVLHKMAFWLSGKVVALHLDNITAKAYLCNQGGPASLFLSGLAHHIFVFHHTYLTVRTWKLSLSGLVGPK